MKKTLFFLLAFIVLCSSKCKEDPLPNPDPKPTPNPTTEEPTGEISCLINGKEWKTGPPFLLSNPNTNITIQKIMDKYELGITAKKRDNNGNGQFFSFGGPCEYGALQVIDIDDGVYYDDIRDCQIDKTDENQIKINKFDTLKRVVWGEFYFKVISLKDTILITNGKFNCNYQLIK